MAAFVKPQLFHSLATFIKVNKGLAHGWGRVFEFLGML
jgi:hypothetical protein